MGRRAGACLIAALFLLCGTADAKQIKPVNTIAPDLVLESLEFGKFPPGHGPLDEGVKPEQYEFIPVPSGVATDQTSG